MSFTRLFGFSDGQGRMQVQKFSFVYFSFCQEPISEKICRSIPRLLEQDKALLEFHTGSLKERSNDGWLQKAMGLISISNPKTELTKIIFEMGSQRKVNAIPRHERAKTKYDNLHIL